MASYIYEPDVAFFSEEIIAFAHEQDEYDMKQFYIANDNPLKGMYYETAFFDLKKQCNVVLIGIVKVKEGQHQLIKNPEHNVTIEAGGLLTDVNEWERTRQVETSVSYRRRQIV
ncbi:MAG: hypothetical protein WDO15_16460 [Bacteroidota bacterium]